jgi:hypothetical protein
MLRCWRILVLAEKLDGFDSVIAQLENLAWRPKQICLDQLRRADLSSGAGGMQAVVGSVAFRPP